MNEQILNLLARLREPGDSPLNADELTELQTGIRARAQELRNAPEGLTEDAVTELRDLATATGEVTAASTTLAEAQATLEADALAALDAIGEDEVAGEGGEGDGAGDGAEGGEGAGAGEGDGAGDGAEGAVAPVVPIAGDAPAGAPAAVEAPAAAADAAPVEAIAASAAAPPKRPTPGQAARRLAPAFVPSRRPQDPEPAYSGAHSTLVAAGGPTDATAGTTVQTMSEVAELTINAHRRMGSPGRAMIASLVTEYPEERHLRHGQDSQNQAKIEAALSEAMVASGGICAPVAVDYTLPSWAVTDRPIKAGLASFQADRGGLTFVQPSALSTWNDATEVWSETTDASPGTATKPVHVVTCGDTDTVLVDAIPTRLRFGNMAGRYFPEQVAYNTTQALAVAARDAETNLWDKMIAATTIAHAPQYLGATRDLLSYLTLGATALRDRGRMGDQQKVRVLIHRLFKDMLRVDLSREIGHAQSADFNSLSITDEQIEDWLNARNIVPIWAMDSPTPVTISSVAIVAQKFANQTAGAVLADWPASCAFTMFPEGGFQFLDGGRLDLGIVRDSTLDATNDYETFIESFESVAFRAVEGITLVAPIVPNGASAGTVAPAEPAE